MYLNKTIWSGMHPKKNQQKPLPKKILDETNSLQINFRKKPPQKRKTPKVPHEKSLPKNNKVKFYPNISEENFSTKQSVKGISIPNKLRIKVSCKQIPKETSTKEYLRKHAYQTFSEDESLRTNVWKEISPPENLSNNIYTKYYPNRNFYQTNLKKHARTKSFEEKSLPKSLSRDIFLAKKIWK